MLLRSWLSSLTLCVLTSLLYKDTAHTLLMPYTHLLRCQPDSLSPTHTLDLSVYLQHINSCAVAEELPLHTRSLLKKHMHTHTLGLWFGEKDARMVIPRERIKIALRLWMPVLVLRIVVVQPLVTYQCIACLYSSLIV